MAVDQWRKWRRPVKTMATPASSQAATTSASRFEPPGWITAVAPASIAAKGPSAKGKKASEATTEPSQRALARRTRPRALSTAIRVESTRLIWPAPIPSVAPSRAKTIAFERTWRQTFQANSRSSHCSSLGLPHGRHGHRLARFVDAVGVLGENAAAYALDVAFARFVGTWLAVEDPNRLLLRQHVERAGLEPGREQDLDELLMQALGKVGSRRAG